MAANDRALNAEQLLSETVWLSGLARGLVHDDEEAEDVAQQVRLAALSKSHDDPAQQRSWLVRVTRNLAMRAHLRRARRERREALAARPEAQPSTLELVARVQAQRRVVGAVLELGEPYRSVVLLRYFDALSAREIAERQGVPVETVRTRIKRAHEQLRARLDRDFGKASWAALLLPWDKAGSAAPLATAGTAALAIASGVTTMGLVAKWGVLAAATTVAAVIAWRALGTDVEPARVSVAQREAAEERAEPAEIVVPAAAGSDVERAAVAPERAELEREAPAVAPDRSTKFVATIVDARDRTPIAGATFELRFQEENAYLPQLATTTSDEAGHVELSVPSIARYGIRAEVRSTEHAPWVDVFVQLERAVDRRLDFGTIELQRGAAIAGRVVEAGSRAPIGGADLWLLCDGAGQLAFGPARSRRVGRSRGDGTFELSERAASQHGHALVLYAVADEGIGWAVFEVVRGRESMDALVVEVAPGATLRVRVVDESGASVEGALVQAEPRFAPLGPASSYPSGHSPWFGEDLRIRNHFVASTDAAGGVELATLPVGREQREFASFERGPFDAYDIVVSKEGYDFAFADRVKVVAGEVVERELVLRRATIGTLVGTIRDADGAPIAGARVSEPRCTLATSGADGAYALARVPTVQGGVLLTVDAEGFRSQNRWVAIGDLVVASAGDAAAGAGPTWRLDFVLERKSRIAGRVLNGRGAPIAGAQIWLAPVEQEGSVSITYRPDPPATDEDGRFTFDDATDGEWRITAFPPGAEGVWHSPTIATAEGGDEDVTIVIEEETFGGARLVVELVESTTGRPAEPSEVTLQPLALASPASKLTPIRIDRELGRAECWPVVAGRWQLAITLTNGWKAVREIHIPGPNDTVHVRVDVGPPGRIELTVDEYRAGDLFTAGWSSSRTTVEVDPTKAKLLEGLTPDQPVRVWITGGGSFDDARVTPRSGETVRVTLRPMPAAFLVLKAPAKSGAGTVELHWSTAAADSPSSSSARTLSGDHWRSRLLRAEPGAILREAVKPGHLVWRARFLPDPGPTSPAMQDLLEGEAGLRAGESIEIELESAR